MPTRLNGGSSESALKTTGKAAADAGIEADSAGELPEQNPALMAALNAADSASHAAFAAEQSCKRSSGKDSPFPSIALTVGYAASFAAKSLPERSEKDWQTRRLIEYLLGRVATKRNGL